jgi:hypothetical protein
MEWIFSALGVVIAAVALGLSLDTRRRQNQLEKGAHVTARFETTPRHGSSAMQYHVILTNSGPARARGVQVHLDPVEFEEQEIVAGIGALFPMDVDVDQQVPLTFVPIADLPARSFDVLMTWTDGNGPGENRVTLIVV